MVGPHQTHGVGFDFVRRLLDDPSELEILGDGTQSKSYVHVTDVVEAVLTAAELAPRPFAAFNVATGDYITVAEIADLCLEVLGLDPEDTVYSSVAAIGAGRAMCRSSASTPTGFAGWGGRTP